jgi:penicillin-binding protein 1C
MEIEINLTALQNAVMAPVTLARRTVARVKRRGFSSPFQTSSRYERLSPAQSRLRMFRMARLAALLGVVSVIVGMMAFFVLFGWYSRDLPKPGQVVRHNGFSTRIMDRTGLPLYDLFDTERRVPVSSDQMPDTLKQAIVAIEDKDFYKHQGFDMLTPFRIAYNMVAKQRVIGGSTLTQQLVKNVLLTNERSLGRKFKEFVLALQIERTFTKDQILEMYLNEAPYGGTAWGVGTASEMYFGKPVSQLNLVESAILAGLPQAPSRYSPYSGKTDSTGELWWKVRTKGVLRRMLEDGYITDLAHQDALSQLDTITFQKPTADIKAPHFVFYVKDKLIEMYGEDMTERGGLKVTTSLDMTLQTEAQKIVAEEIEKIKDFNITNGATVVMKPATGEILSMVGSKDYFATDIDGQFNVAADGLRQPGSSIKPVTYLAMFQKGYTPASVLVDAPTIFTPNASADKYEPKNYDGKFRGPVNIRTSLGSSLNIGAVKSLAIVGVEPFLKQAYTMGFPTLEPTADNMKRFGLAVTLGGGEVHLIDTVTAYSGFANGGRRVEPVSILKVEDRDGNVLYEYTPVEGQTVMTAEEAFLINHILSDNSARAPAFGANSLLNTGKPIAVKTGTTNDQRDNWTIGWSQEVMVGTWVGNNDNSPMKRVASGVTGASPIWRKIMDYALKNGYKAPEWVVPSGVEEVEVDALSGYPSHDGFLTRKEYFIKGTLPSLPDPLHSKLKLCRGENKLANDARISSGDYDEKEYLVLRESDPVSQDGLNRWQEGINAWIAGQPDEKYKPPTEYCGESTDIFVRLNKPENEKKYDSEDIEINAEADSGDGIEKLEIYVNGNVKETVNGRTYSGTIKLPAGRYEIWVKARSRSGKERESGKAKIGTGGQDWKANDPTPAPTPSPSPTPAPTPSASPLVSPVPTPSP